jgi:hypothetical protein
VRGVRGGAAVSGGSSVKVSTRWWREHPCSKGRAPSKLRRSGAHPIVLASMRQRRGGGGHDVTAVAMLQWSTTAAKGSCSLRGPRRGERRSAKRMRMTGGVSSLKRGHDDGGGSNSSGSDGGFRR